MKILTTILLMLSTQILSQHDVPQVVTKCYVELADGTRLPRSCDGFKRPSRPGHTMSWDLEAFTRNMEKELVAAINAHRGELGLEVLEFSPRLLRELTIPHNRYQVAIDSTTHCDHMGNYMRERGPFLEFCGYRSLGENVASHSRWDTDKGSLFFRQYMESPRHRSMIEDPKWRYYSTSVMYNTVTNRFYNTFNVAR